jgi:hypothetical protein
MYISRIWGADPTEPIVVIFGTSRDLADLINCAKFHIDGSKDYGVAGVQKSHMFPYRKAESFITRIRMHCTTVHAVAAVRDNPSDTQL